MLKSKEAVISGIEKYYIHEIAPLGWTLALATPFVAAYILDFVNKNNEIIALVSKDNLIDVTALIDKYREVLRNTPEKHFNIKGVKLYESDLEKLLHYIEKENS